MMMRRRLTARFLAQLEGIGWTAHVWVFDLWQWSFGMIWFRYKHDHPTPGEETES